MRTAGRGGRVRGGLGTEGGVRARQFFYTSTFLGVDITASDRFEVLAEKGRAFCELDWDAARKLYSHESESDLVGRVRAQALLSIYLYLPILCISLCLALSCHSLFSPWLLMLHFDGGVRVFIEPQDRL